MTLSVRYLVALGVAALWLVPSANSNIWPHYQAGETATVINQSFFVLAMASLPILAGRLPAWSLKQAGCVILGLALFSWSIYNALHMGGAAQATATQSTRATLGQAEGHRAQIAALEARMQAITSKPGYKYVSKDSVASAESSLQAATEKAASERKTGCGPTCLRYEAAVEARRQERDKLLAARDESGKADVIEEEIRAENQKLAELGTLPEATDQAAAMLGDLGNVAEKKVSKFILFLYAFGVEGMAFLGPICTVYVLSPVSKGVSHPLPLPHSTPLPKAVEAPAAPAKRSTRKRGGKKETPSRTPEECVREWLGARTAAGEMLQCSKALADYQARCRATGADPMNMTKFGQAMSALGFSKVKKSGCLHYVGITLRKEGADLRVVNA